MCHGSCSYLRCECLSTEGSVKWSVDDDTEGRDGVWFLNSGFYYVCRHCPLLPRWRRDKWMPEAIESVVSVSNMDI